MGPQDGTRGRRDAVRRVCGVPSSPAPADDIPTFAFASRADWHAWLAEHHASATAGLWLKLAKAGRGIETVSYAEAVEVALCFGWVDGQKRACDDDFWLQKFTPRRARSRWSEVNRAKALALIDSGAMQPTGLAEVERAQADGRWDAAYAPASTATVPPDLQAALDADPAAAAFFETLSAANRYAILWRVGDAKRPETRARRIATFVAMLAAGETLH
jgi:uncharacterized protein YdeI (YjbR/CyaY-like superfamily)